MHDQEHKPEDQNLLEELGYETRDVPVQRVPRSMYIFFAALLATGIIAYAFMYIVAPDMTLRPQLSRFERERVPPPDAPLLQSNVTAHQDMVDLIAEERERSTTYGWTDRQTGTVRVPVDQAMQAVIAEGLPSKNQAVPKGEVPSAVVQGDYRR